MPERLDSMTVSMEQRQALIAALPCFAMLTDQESRELALLMTEISYQPDEKIVEENALVDQVFIIATGQAEVSRQSVIKKRKIIRRLNKTVTTPVAILNPGEAIGLNDTGFFSQTGTRTATVTAISEVLVLSLDLKTLHDFLSLYPHLQSAMHAASEQMLRMRLIKQSLPFSRLSQKHLKWLADQVEEVSILSGQTLFHEGEVGDRCYLIRSGQIEIVAKNDDGTEHQLAILTAPALFGEATFMTHATRNATAHALEDTELFALKYECLSELFESENNTAHAFMTLMIDRSRPQQNPDVMAHQRITADAQLVVILKNPENGNYFKLSEEGWYIWQHMDGKKTMREITLALADEYNIFAPDIIAGLISKLARAGFVKNVEMDDTSTFSAQPRWVRMMLRMRGILESRRAFGDADKWITKLYDKGGFLLFTRLGKIALATLIFAGFFAFGFSTPYVIHLFKTVHNSWMLFVLLIPLTLLSVMLHELGHALATKSFGYEVHYMGVGWYWLGPVAFTDTSDMWLSTRGPRIFVNLAGAGTDLLVAAVSSFMILLTTSEYLQAFLWLFALFTYISSFRMLSPLQELDGYYALMDIFDRPRLRQSAVMWLVKDFPKACKKPALFKKHIPECCYWLACIIFLILTSAITYLVQSFVFKMLGFKPSNVFVSLALPILVMLTSSLGIIADIRSQAED